MAHVSLREKLLPRRAGNDYGGHPIALYAFWVLMIPYTFRALVHFLVSLLTHRDPEKQRLTWTELGGHDPALLKKILLNLLLPLVPIAKKKNARATMKEAKAPRL